MREDHKSFYTPGPWYASRIRTIGDLPGVDVGAENGANIAVVHIDLLTGNTYEAGHEACRNANLIAAGEIEGFIIGRRGVRAYLDSVASYQERHAIVAMQPDHNIERSRRRVANAAGTSLLRAATTP